MAERVATATRRLMTPTIKSVESGLIDDLRLELPFAVARHGDVEPSSPISLLLE